MSRKSELINFWSRKSKRFYAESNKKSCKKCWSRMSRKSKHNNFWSRKSKRIYAGSNKQVLKNVGRQCGEGRKRSIFSQESQNVSLLGRTKSKTFFVGSRKPKHAKIWSRKSNTEIWSRKSKHAEN